MTDTAHPPAEGKKKFSITEGWGLFLLVLALLVTGVITMIAQQLGYFITIIVSSIVNAINNFFQMLSLRQGPMLLIVAGVLAYFLFRKKKPVKKAPATPPAHP